MNITPEKSWPDGPATLSYVIKVGDSRYARKAVLDNGRIIYFDAPSVELNSVSITVLDDSLTITVKPAEHGPEGSAQ